MIILSVGMPRAGSGWYYNLTNDLMLATGAQDARQIRQRYRLQGILTEVNCNIGALTPRRITAVMLPSVLGNTFVVKAHAALTPYARFMIQRGLIRSSYIYRDPRDAMLSIMENGQRALQRGHANAFSPFAEFEAALDFMVEYLHIWESWMDCRQVLLVRYEDLLLDYETEAGQLLKFLNLDQDHPQIQAVVEKYRPEKAQPDQKGIHFSHGKIGRFRQKMSTEQQAIMADLLGAYLIRMGYAA
jgi:Sulfotransferase domain